mmetsp:Transcript_16350/g.25524  ORF Transcript_16350/g.25524 Transcript_16350/m.25524 type:complete len:531 (+) Transcript_16350:46-1638(+)|eukprot:CAMPEP_0196801820 /NCGR_PEP_ID=MMETSP1362-20130617/1601_1 /TAXON_ID=163516 /ORGANISM="Leptocylindrus danicus, Strain CCMP1856" /LENGTH=530 /DNA_ID=CAMNT_0042172967 /DNA_START=46 /DNA_END=1638 /DNA_ORIENTATION=+
MKIYYCLSTLLFSFATANNISLRGGDDPYAECEVLKNPTECATSEKCTWCECAAVPSMCVPSDQASNLPPSVWSCHSTPSESSKTEKIYKYPHLSQSHSFSSEPIESDFCDPESPLSLSGYMSVEGSKFDKKDDKELFYWFFESRNKVEGKTPPLIVWLTGGPGCSSTLALLFENGPCKVNESGDGTVSNPNSWNTNAHMLWLDQPAGVGFSYGATNDSNEEMISEDAYYFLQAFFKTHPEYLTSELFIVGESYGGHYAPAIAHRVMVGNQQNLPGTHQLKLTGLGVGNGLTDPAIQYQYYAEMAYNNSHGIKCVDENAYESMKKATSTCVSMIDSCNSGGWFSSFSCQASYAYCNTKVTGPYSQTGLNPYDIRKQCGDNDLCYDFTNIEKFLNLESTRKALHVTEKSSKWESCNMNVNMKFTGDFTRSYASEVADLLNNGIRTVIYAGDVDFICNYMGNRAWTQALDWNHKEEFNQSEDVDWFNGSGMVRSSNGFTFLQVYDAGHMVPADQPEAALQLINSFIAGENFV